MFYVVTGIDGAGKSSIIEALSKRGMKTCNVTPEFALSSAEYAKPLIDMKPREFFQDMPPLERSTFLSLLVSLTFERHIKPALTDGEDILCDSYWYKYAAKECVINPNSARYLLSFFESLPTPDKVIILETEPTVAWERKGGSATPFEYGGGNRSDIRTAFIDFQEQVSDNLLAMPPSSVTSSIKTDRGPEELADHVENLLYGRIERLLPEASPELIKLYSVSFINYFAAGTAVTNEVVFVVDELGSSPTAAGVFISAAAVIAIFSTILFGRVLPEGTTSRGWSLLLLTQGTLAICLVFISGHVQVLLWLSFMALIPVSQSAAISVVSAMQTSDIVVVRSRIRVIINVAMALGASSWSALRLFGFSPSWIYFVVGCILIVSGLTCRALLDVVQEKNPPAGDIVDGSRSFRTPRLGNRFWVYIFSYFPFFLGSGLLSFGVPFIILHSSGIDQRSIGVFFAVNMLLVVLFQVKVSRVVDTTRSLPLISAVTGVCLLAAFAIFSAFPAPKAGLLLITITVVIVSFVEIMSSNIDFKIFYHLAPRHLYGSASTARTSSESCAQVLAPLIIPLLLVVNTFLFVVLLVILGSLWCLSLWRLSASVSR